MDIFYFNNKKNWMDIYCIIIKKIQFIMDILRNKCQFRKFNKLGQIKLLDHLSIFEQDNLI